MTCVLRFNKNIRVTLLTHKVLMLNDLSVHSIYTIKLIITLFIIEMSFLCVPRSLYVYNKHRLLSKTSSDNFLRYRFIDHKTLTGY